MPEKLLIKEEKIKASAQQIKDWADKFFKTLTEIQPIKALTTIQPTFREAKEEIQTRYLPTAKAFTKEFQPTPLPTGQRTVIPRGETKATREAFAEHKRKVEEYKEWKKGYDEGKIAWDKWQEDRKNKITALYKDAVKYNIPSYEPTSGQVALGMPFGVPKNIAPLMMQGITQQENQRQLQEHWQKQIGMGLEPEVRAGLPPEVLNIPPQLQQALDQSEFIKQAKSEEEEMAKGRVFQRVAQMVEMAKANKQDVGQMINMLMASEPEALRETFGYPITPQDISDAYELYTKTLLGEFGG